MSLEFSGSPEVTTQRQYVQNLQEHAASIQDLTPTDILHPLTKEQEAFLEKYTQTIYTDELRKQGVEPLFRPDINDPEFCNNTEALTREVANSSNQQNTWYKDYYRRNNSRYTEPREIWLGKEWDLFFVRYIRKRRQFHASFMQAVLDPQNNLEIGDLLPQNPLTPPTTLNSGNKQDAPRFLYNQNDWLACSTINALSLPPELCDANMKRRAIELFASLADPEDETIFTGIYSTSFKHLMQLPWSMRTNTELQAQQHTRWRTNTYVQSLLGELHNPHSDGWTRLLHERPKDYVQIALLNLFSNPTSTSMRNLTSCLELSPEIQDIIFAEDASFNTVFGPQTFPMSGGPVTLQDFLNQTGEPLSTKSHEDLLEGQSLRIQILQGELADAKEALRTKDAHIASLEAAIEELTQTATHNSLTPIQQSMKEFGIDPSAPDEIVHILVNALRRKYNKDLQLSGNPDDEEKLKGINNTLDRILQSRGLNGDTSYR